MKTSLGLDMVHVPFKGTGQSVPALVGGQVDMLFSAYPSLIGFVKEAIPQMAGAGIDPVGAGPEEYAKAIASENARMATAIKVAGMKSE